MILEEQPGLYDTAAHYEKYACVLVRLSRVNRELLGGLLCLSHRFVVEKYKSKKKARCPHAPPRPQLESAVRRTNLSAPAPV